MKTKIKTGWMSMAFMFCIGAFFTPVAAYASGGEDTIPPVVHAEVSGGVLHIEASDEDSGVDAVYIGGKRINYRVDHAVDLELEDVAWADRGTVAVYAVDFAGNQSGTVEVANPLYEAGPAEKPFTPDGQADVVDHATDGDGKEFYTFSTPEGNVFYLVVDRQRESENVYFLSAVTEDGLLALAGKGAGDGSASESAVAEPVVCGCTKKCVAGEVNIVCPVCKNDLKACVGKEAEPLVEEEPGPEQPEKGGGGAVVFVLLAVAAVGGAGYYFKIYKPKHDLDDAEDLEDLLGDDGPEVDEDEELPERDGAYQPEPGDGVDMDALAYDDYPDGGPGWGG